MSDEFPSSPLGTLIYSMYPDIKRIELTMIVSLGIRVDYILAAEISATRDIPRFWGSW